MNLRPYRCKGLQKDVIEKLIQEMFDSGIIRNNNNPYSSPMMLVKKKNDIWMLCINYRTLNQVTIKDRYPILLIDELLDKLKKTFIFFKISLCFGY